MSHSSRAVLVGRTLQDKYRIDRVVGEGGFGVVYAARHLTLDVPVAVKALVPHSGLPPEQRAMLLARFSSEAQILARLRHPNIVSVLDFGVEEDATTGPIQWLVLEWCDGETLDAELRRRRKTSPRPPLRSIQEAWALMRPVVDAIAYGHALGVAHRDLKPSNVMLVPCRTGVSPRVVDFGIAKRLEDVTTGSGDTLTGSGTALFTPQYAAPEQVAMVRTGPWTDVHALGLLFTEVLTDQRPYPSHSGAVAAVDPERPTPAHFGRDVGALEPVLAKALALRPAERYADAEALLEALDDVFGIGRVPAPRPFAGSEAGRAAAHAPEPFLLPDETLRTGPKTLGASTSETSAVRSRSRLQWLVLGAVAVTAFALSVGVIAIASLHARNKANSAAAEQGSAEPASATSAENPVAASTSTAPEPSASAPADVPSSAPGAPPPKREARPPSQKSPPAPTPSLRARPTATPPATGRPQPALY